jgi:hypothetical protein
MSDGALCFGCQLDSGPVLAKGYTHLALALEVEDGKRADIADTIHVDSKFAKEVDDSGRRAW